MFNTKYQEIRMQSIVFVTLRIPNNETEIPLTKKDRYRLRYICIESKHTVITAKVGLVLILWKGLLHKQSIKQEFPLIYG